jgi:peptidoglycan/xylan/chitin deacetylase (PgdA/CDA1 family)
MVIVTQSWDDGVIDDVRLIELLRKHKAKGTFNLNPGLHRAERYSGWAYRGKPVYKLSIDEVKTVYCDVEVAGHSLTHPSLEKLPPEALHRELAEGRRILEDWLQRPVRGFAYPFGAYNDAVKCELRNTGHVYARTVKDTERVFPPGDPMEFHPSLHHASPHFWTEFERVKRAQGVFFFWGHSYEFLTEAMWDEFEAKLARLSADPDVCWKTNIELFVRCWPEQSPRRGRNSLAPGMSPGACVFNKTG